MKPRDFLGRSRPQSSVENTLQTWAVNKSNYDQMYSVERRGFMESGRNDLNKQGVHMKTKELRHKRRKYDGLRKILKFKAHNLIMDSRTVRTGRYCTWFAFRSETFIDLVRGTD